MLKTPKPLISLLLLNVVFIGLGCSNESQNPATEEPQIAFQVVAEWKIPNGGYGRVIVIDSTHQNETDLIKLARQLNNFTRKDRNAFINIYDNYSAATMRQAALSPNEILSKKDLAFHDSHMIGFYVRNINTGYHGITITLQGLMGPAKEIAL